MRRVSFVIPTLDRSGAEKQLLMLAQAGHGTRFDAEIVCLDRLGPLGETLTMEDTAIPVTVIGKRGKFDPAAIGRLRRHLRGRQPDVVHSWLFAALGYAWFAKPRATKWVHGLRCVDSWMSAFQRLQMRLYRGGPDAFVANSAAVADWYRERGIRAAVIPNAIAGAPDASSQSVEALRRRWSLDSDAKVVVAIGRLAPQKRLRDLLWAFQLLRQTDPRSRLVVVGDGPQKVGLKQYAADIECAEDVRFVGHDANVPAWLALADAYWLGSDFEGQSNSLMEAMAAGVPVVATSIPPNRELVTHGDDGFLVDVGDAAGFAQFTNKLWQDVALVERITGAAKQRMQARHSVDAMLDAYAGLYERLADPTPAASAAEPTEAR